MVRFFRQSRLKHWAWVLVLLLVMQPVVLLGQGHEIERSLLYFPIVQTFVSFVEVSPGSASWTGVSGEYPVLWGAAPIEIGPYGHLYVAWLGGDASGMNIYGKTWDGMAWGEIGTGSSTGLGISGQSEQWLSPPAMTVTPDGMVYLFWVNFTDQVMSLDVRRWDGQTWSMVGTQPIAPERPTDFILSTGPAIAAAADSSVYIAWNGNLQDDRQIPNAMYVLHWTGSDWQEVGSGSATGYGINPPGDWDLIGYPSLAVDPSGNPCVSSANNWIDSMGHEYWDPFVTCWNGSSWVSHDAGLPRGAWITDTDLARDASGTLYLATEEYNGQQYQVFLRRWNGTTWEPLAPGQGIVSAISQDSCNSHSPEINIGPDGRVVIYWVHINCEYQLNYLPASVYMAYWDNGTWRELAGTTARGAGISYHSTYTSDPAAGIGAGGELFVSWLDHSLPGQSPSLYLMRSHPSLLPLGANVPR